MTAIKVKVTDFEYGSNPESNFLVQFLRERYEVEFSEDPDFLIYSVWGKEHCKYDCVKIFYTGEPAAPDFNECDYAIGFDDISFDDRYMRLPLFAMRIDTTMIDIRPFPIKNAGCGIARLDFIQSDATDLDIMEDNSVESLSSLHAVEHFGLGRYGDTVNPNACFEAMYSMGRVLKRGGYLYFGVPVGKTEKVCFNAHRIFYPNTVVKSFQNLTLVNMYLIHDMEVSEYTPDEVNNEKYCDIIGDYDCGIFIFTK